MIYDADMDVVAKAAQRWRDRAAERDARHGRPTAEVENPQRIQARLDRLSKAAGPAAAVRFAETATPPDASVLREIGLERTLGTNDFQNIAFLELALAVSRFVGRISIKSSPTRLAGFGTGSMVSPRLLLTNNHVLPSAESARFSEVEFDYQLDRSGNQLQAYPFVLQPDSFFMTDPELDFSLVAVAERSRLDRDLKHYGWSRLIAEQGKILIGEHVNIIQHPRGQFKQFVSRENEVVDILDNYLHYVTDTEPGSSGSPVYNDQWEIVALHHSGVPRMSGDRYIDKKGNIWDGSDPEDIDWVANEGVRVSKLVEFIAAQPLDGERARLRDDLLQTEPPHPIEAARLADHALDRRSGRDRPEPGRIASPDSDLRASHPGRLSFTIPLRVSVEIGAPVADRAADGDTAKPEPALTAAAAAPGRAPELAAALAELARAPARTYYDAEADRRARELYYKDIDGDADGLYARLSDLVTATHKTKLSYAPARHLYPWVDLRQGDPPRIKSIYSGKGFDPAELIEADFAVDVERARVAEAMAGAGGRFGRESAIALLEAELPYNCEHVVPQSWFEKREPMRGDLHHLFACESGCNSFRGNSPYFDFPDFQEVLREDCGKKESAGFEPTFGKGAVARATLYFLLRYPRLVGDAPGELGSDRLSTLLAWHDRFPVDDYERHRNAAIFEMQGNRNPLVDHPEWADRIDFKPGFAGPRSGAGPHSRESAGDLAAAVAAINALEPPAATGDEAALAGMRDGAGFGHYDGLPARVALLDDGRKLKLLAPLSYVQQDGSAWPAPAGAVVDGASIPRVFWSLIGGPLEGRYRDASIVHDTACTTRLREWPATHRMFYEAMRCSGVGEAKARVMYYAVRRFGPRWEVAQEASVSPQRVPTDRDADTILADAEAIYMHGLDLDEIDHLAEARELAPVRRGGFAAEAAGLDAAALDRARLLVVTGGAGTADDLEAVAREAARLPAYVMKRFEKKKIRIVACRDGVTDFERSLRGKVPRGWEGTGRTWDDVPGTYLQDRKRVVIATVADGTGRTVPTRGSGRHGSISLTVHESLHGYDYSGGHAVLRDAAFLQARDADLTGLDAYERQVGRAGLEETFAETGARFVAEPERLNQDLPHLFAFWQSRAGILESLAAPLETAGSDTEPVTDADAPIGTIEQGPRGVILHLRAEGPGGAIGHAAIPLSPSDPFYPVALGQIQTGNAASEAAGTREALLHPPRSRPASQPRSRSRAGGARSGAAKGAGKDIPPA